MIQEMVNVSEYRKNLHDDYIAGALRGIEKGKTRFSGNFYLEVPTITKRLYRPHGEASHIFFPRKTCPVPVFNRSVYKYYANDDRLEMLWCLPNEADCLDYYHNRHLVHPEEYCLLEQVMNYFTGELFKLTHRMETEDENP